MLLYIQKREVKQIMETKLQIIKNYIETHRDEIFDKEDPRFVIAVALFKAEQETGIDYIDFMSYIRYGRLL